MLLIDEIDRADHEFEAFLLEFLSDFQISIPERGTIKATTPPVVVLTSNRTRDLHEALRRRCVYHWITYPDATTRSAHRHAARAAMSPRQRRARSSPPSRPAQAAARQAAGHLRSGRMGKCRRNSSRAAAAAGRMPSAARSALRSRTRTISPM